MGKMMAVWPVHGTTDNSVWGWGVSIMEKQEMTQKKVEASPLPAHNCA